MLGTLAAAERRDPVVVVSGDRDLLQLVADEPVEVRVLYLGRGLSNAVMFGPAEVAEKYGVPAHRAGPAYAELALLRGDPSDGLPGVPGVGEKTAATHAGPVRLAGGHPGRRARSEIEAAQGVSGQAAGRHRLHRGGRARWWRWPATPPSRCPPPADALPLAAADPARVAELAKAYGVGSSIGRLQKALDALPGSRARHVSR